MEIWATVCLALSAFVLGSVPFSVLIGRWFLGKDIRQYGDGNPGAVNVFRAGGQLSGLLAVVLDVAKGTPFVFLAGSIFQLPEAATVVVALAAVLGHAFSPFLRWRGGKAVAVTFGVLISYPHHEALLAFTACMILGALFIEEDSWTVMFGAAGALGFLAVVKGGSWDVLLMLCILALFALKQYDGLHSLPGFRGRLVRWVQSIWR